MIRPFNPRVRYLTGFDPRRRYLTGLRQQKRLLMGRFNPRIRYLTGLGDDGSVDPSEGIDLYPITPGTDPFPLAPPDIEPDYGTPQTVTPPYPSSAAPGTVTGTIQYGSGPILPAVVNSQGVTVQGGVNSAGQIVPLTSASSSVSAWLKGTSSLGLPNSTLLIGIGAIVLLASMSGSSSGGKRR